MRRFDGCGLSFLLRLLLEVRLRKSTSCNWGCTCGIFCKNNKIDKLFLFYGNRSGLLCTVDDPIYIHENPLELIRVISSVALMSLSKLVTSEITVPRHSFDSEIPLNLLLHGTEEIKWEITLGNNVYRTVEYIYKPWCEIMIGTAMLVWKAVCVKEDDVKSPHAQQS
ncbi:hypothetical protein D9613_005649 [Agrocybe pediades]|uniref:Uncharacterized protein n=1 Tax=Agrocybe pediades TaxID=84607 RepID=A0A8H4QUU6_9AGAR|nr:hypothetical protein D9613_005649 [Agrocybe pediades]